MEPDPMQRCEHFVAGLRSQPWWDPADFPLVQALEAAAGDIRTELEDYVLAGTLRRHPQSHGGPRAPLTAGNWNIVELCSGGRRHAGNAIHAPVTMGILMAEPAVVTNRAGLAYFSVLDSHAHVDAHCGPTNARLRIHLGLHVPPDSRIRVGHAARHWQSGRCLVFDDSWEHEVWNDSPIPRSVLIVDIVHPDLRPEQDTEAPGGSRSQPVADGPPHRQREGWLPDRRDAGPRPPHELLDEALAAVGTSRAAAIRAAAQHARLQPLARPGLVPRPWSRLASLLQGLDQEEALDLVQACAVLWRGDRGQEAAARAVLDRWPPPMMADLVRRLVRLPDIAARAEFLAAYERQQNSPPFGATAPLLVTAARTAGRVPSRARQVTAVPGHDRPDRALALDHDPISGPNDRELAELFGIARTAALVQLARPPGEPIPPVPPGCHAWTVNITLLLRGQLRGSMTGQGSTLSDAVALGARRAARDTRWGPALTHAELRAATMELWVQTRGEPLSPHTALTSFDLGVDGIQLRRDGHSAYFKPSVPLTGGLTQPVRLYRRLARKAGLHADAWCQPGTELCRTSWQHYLENPALREGVARLHRLRPLRTPAVTRVELAERIGLACDRLVATQDQSGFFLYLYHPFTGHRPRSFSAVRQAGCAYALALIGAAAGGPGWPQPESGTADHAASWRGGAVRAVSGLLREERVAPVNLAAPGGDASGHTALGMVALLLRALQCAGPTGRSGGQRAALCSAILGAQQADGSFLPHIAGGPPGHRDAEQNFYPGEALLALCHEAALGRADCAEAISRSFRYYRHHFQRSPDPGFVLWQAETWTRACDLIREGLLPGLTVPECAGFVFDMVDWLLPFQQLRQPGAPADFTGGFRFHGAAPGFSTAMYTEATIRAYQVACAADDASRAERYRLAARNGLQFLCRLQATPEMAPLFREPWLAVGGTTRTLIDFTMRSDFDQHAGTAFLAAVQASIVG